MPPKDAPRIEVRSVDALHRWLAEDQAGSGVWLVTFKRHHPDHIPWDNIVEELLCWGWIDSQPAKLDADRSMLWIAPRNPKANWSARNKAHVARMEAEGRMQPQGEALVALAQATGTWTALDEVEALVVPLDLAKALDDAGQREAWDDFAPSARRGILEWLLNAKRPDTRARRITQIVEDAAAGRVTLQRR